MAEADLDRRRLAFGRVAELYDRARPAYPPPVIDELISFAGLRVGAPVLEVGAGTGKATRMLGERGLAVTALEPDAAMASVARRNCAGHPLVEIEQIAFEDWQAREQVEAVVSAQAWHWIRPEARYVRAGEALAPGGTLASIWTLPVWTRTSLRDSLYRAYLQTVPDLAPDFPMHPGSDPADLAGDWHAEIDASGEFTAPLVLSHRWSLSYSTEEYRALLQTHQDHILLEPAEQGRLLDAVSQVIDDAGGSFALDLVTRLCLARRV